mmetsp:Transcript_11349/g.20394  ORF Transcript_11349/g.20394 Transcript_11349/m.20394 type:complete len:280 (-) Transcript_11349:65-904(-)
MQSARKKPCRSSSVCCVIFHFAINSLLERIKSSRHGSNTFPAANTLIPSAHAGIVNGTRLFKSSINGNVKRVIPHSLLYAAPKYQISRKLIAMRDTMANVQESDSSIPSVSPTSIIFPEYKPKPIVTIPNDNAPISTIRLDGTGHKRRVMPLAKGRVDVDCSASRLFRSRPVPSKTPTSPIAWMESSRADAPMAARYERTRARSRAVTASSLASLVSATWGGCGCSSPSLLLTCFANKSGDDDCDGNVSLAMVARDGNGTVWEGENDEAVDSRSENTRQ